MMEVEIESANKIDPVDQIKVPSEPSLTPEKPKENNHHKQSKSRKNTRSRTPQKKTEEPKVIHLSLKKVEEEEVNGQENGNHEKISETVDKPKNDDQKQTEDKPTEVENGESAKIESVTEHKTEAENGFSGFEKGVNDDKKSVSTNSQETEEKSPEKEVEMDPLVVPTDEIDPELEFLEENSDKDSEKGSPLLSRCNTRRSYTRNIPTPKTPKIPDQETDSEKNSVVDQSEEICNLPNSDIPSAKSDSLSTINDSVNTEDASTKAVAGNDSTRFDFSESSNSTDHDNSYLSKLRKKNISARKPIRGGEDYRKKVLKNAQHKSDLNSPFLHVNAGLKRKNRSLSPEDTKKIRIESPGYRSFFTSPLASLRNTLWSDVQSSTPELLGYKDGKNNLLFSDNSDLEKIEDTDEEGKKKWCSVM